MAKKKKPREKPRKSEVDCESCNCGGGFPRLILGWVFQICDGCWPSEFRRGRVVERFMARQFVAAMEELKKCGLQSCSQ